AALRRAGHRAVSAHRPGHHHLRPGRRGRAPRAVLRDEVPGGVRAAHPRAPLPLPASLRRLRRGGRSAMSFAPVLASLTEAWLFYPMAIVAIGGALGMIVSRNPVHGAMFLVLSFFGIASIYVLLAAELVAALQIIIYAGAIMVLFVFVIMLLNLHEDELEKPRLTLGTVLGGAAALAFWAISFMVFADLPEQGMPTDLPEGFGRVAAVGRLIFNQYL